MSSGGKRKHADEEEMEEMFDYAKQHLTKKVTPEETRKIYWSAVDVWRMQINRTWHPTSRNAHACTRETCTFDNLHAKYIIERGVRGGSAVRHICVSTDPAPHAPVYCGGMVNHADAMSDRAVSDHVRGAFDNAYVCKNTAHLHICHPKLCTEVLNGLGSGGAFDVCGITGRAHGSVHMVHKFWKPNAVAGSTEGTPMTRRDVLNGRLAFARLKKSSDYSFGYSWSDVMESIRDQTIGEIDTPARVRTLLRLRRPRRETFRDAFNEYYAWTYMRVASLYSSARFEYDLNESRRMRAIAYKNIGKHVRSTSRMLTVADVRIMQIAQLDRHRLPMTITLEGDMRHKFIMVYAARCMSFWGAICLNSTDEEGGAANCAAKFVFQDFVIAAMYMFAEGVFLPPDVTKSVSGEHLMLADEMLKWTLPKLTSIKFFACDREAVIAQQHNITHTIIQAVRDRGINPARLAPNAVKLSDLTIDILPPLHRQRDRIVKK